MVEELGSKENLLNELKKFSLENEVINFMFFTNKG